MTIQIKITQMCNRCKKTRELDPKGFDPHRVNGQKGGWREVKDDRHLCPECIELVITTSA